MQRSSIAAAHQWMAPSLRGLAKGQRAFCNWDEDPITMAVEAARDALDSRSRSGIESLTLASTTLPFADLQSSAFVAAGLNLSDSVRTLDIGYSQRAATSGLIGALQQQGDALFIASEQPPGKPASTQEISNGAGAAAFTLGTDNILAEVLSTSSKTALFTDHFRAADGDYDYHWEERWVRDEGYMKLLTSSISAALTAAGVAASAVDHFILASPLRGGAAAVMRKLGIKPEAEADMLAENCGYSGTAHGLLMLAHCLETAAANQIIVVASFAQGGDVLVLRTTEAITCWKPRRGVSAALADAQSHDAYLRMLSYRGGIELEWGMRAEKQVKTAFTEQYRSSNQLAAFTAGKCSQCDTIQFPQLPYCVNPACNSPRANFTPYALFDEEAAVLTYTADALSYHPAPPLYVGFVQFENGARLLMEMTDVGASGLEVGTPLRMAFRIKDADTTRGYPRYFWKAVPINGN
ncbi:MAG: hypothetical protein GYB33_02750 [Gammaproteobacteria bacterium]|nr:hypothetical protein [Gammaproteobacteria bacterium]